MGDIPTLVGWIGERVEGKKPGVGGKPEARGARASKWKMRSVSESPA